VIDRASHAFTRIDVPTRRTFEPAPAGQLKAPAVAGALEGHFRHDGFGADHLEVEARPHRVLHEAELHQGRFEQHAPLAKQRQELGSILAPNVDRGVARVTAFEA
jgi:hypothetical protein